MKPRKNLVLRKAQLAMACCLICALVQAAFTTYLLTRNLRSAKETSSATQIQNGNLTDLISSQVAGWMAKSNEEKPRAHLTGIDKQNSLEATSAQQALQWEDHYGLAFLKNGMKYVNRSLEIPQSGDYFVYAQVTFRAIDCTNTNSEKKCKTPIMQVVSRFTANYPEPAVLLSGSKYLCEMKSGWCPPISIYLGAVFHMMQGDRLMVNVTNVTLVDITLEHKTYFGAFLL